MGYTEADFLSLVWLEEMKMAKLRDSFRLVVILAWLIYGVAVMYSNQIAKVVEIALKRVGLN